MNPVVYFDEYQKPKIEESTNKIFNLESTKDPGIVLFGAEIEDPKTAKKQPKKDKSIKPAPGGGVMIAPEDDSSDLPMAYSNQPYMDSYNETNAMLKGSMNAIDLISAEVMQEFEAIRNSKTLKNKYVYLTNMASALGSLQASKLTAVREMNKTINDCHNLELKRVKEMKLDQNAVSDDKAVQDMYNAFMSMPYTGAPIAPTPIEMTMMNGSNIPRMAIGSADFGVYQQNLSPVQNAWRMESNPNIKTVVVYDQATGNRYFDVVDVSTGMSVPNVDKPDIMFLEDTTLDVYNRRAMNTNLNTEWDMVILNADPNIANY